MPDPFVQGLVQNAHDVDAATTAARLSLALVFGIVIAGIHYLFRRMDNRPGGLGTTLILLCVIVALVTVAIGESTARAFGLVGALSIVRFRTTVGDTRDTAFVIFSVAVGMALGAGYLMAAVVAVPVIAAACGIAGLTSRRHGATAEVRLKITSTADAEAAMKDLLGHGIVRYRLLRGGTGRKGASVDLTYTVWFATRTDPAAIIEQLRSRPGVQKAVWNVK